MLEEIYIENFRCFQKTTLKKISKFNLIGGLNNSGKSALLEAIIFSLCNNKRLINKLVELRNVEDKNPLYKERAWNYFFYNLNSNKPIIINCLFSNNKNYNIKITKEKIEKISDLPMYDELENNKKLARAKKEFSRFFSENSHTYSLNTYREDKNSELIHSYVYTDKGEIERRKNLEGNEFPIAELAFLSSKRDIDHELLLSILNEVIAQGKFSEIISALQNIDNTINDIREIDNKIMLARKDMVFLPMGLFGDAIQVLLDIVLSLIILPENSILIIDEIENGIHHTKHELILNTIYNLISNKNIQVFATSHSAEFINTYNNFVFKKIPPSLQYQYSYFELIKARNDKIIANKIDPDTLNFKIDNQRSFRGEP